MYGETYEDVPLVYSIYVPIDVNVFLPHLSVSGHKVLITKQTELGYRPFAPLDNAGGVFLCERRNKLCAAYLLYL